MPASRYSTSATNYRDSGLVHRSICGLCSSSAEKGCHRADSLVAAGVQQSREWRSSPLACLSWAAARCRRLGISGTGLRRYRLDAVVSSDLARAWTTGRIVAEGLGVPLIREPGLREAQIGEAEGLFRPEVKSRFGEALTERWFTEDNAAFPGGETGLETRTRGLAALRRSLIGG